MSRKRKPATSGPKKWVEDAIVGVVKGMIRVVSALPARWVLVLGNGIAWALMRVDGRGRKIAHQNLDVVFGDTLDAKRRREIVRSSYRESVRAVLLLLHLHPMTAERWHRWSDLPEDAHDDPRLAEMIRRGAVLVSGHIGNWELLLGMRTAFPEIPETVFVAETLTRGVAQRIIEHLRSHGVVAAMRKGGSRLVMNTVRRGGVAAVLADRNVRGVHGGIYVPFLGLPARTTPLPAWLAVRNDVPLHPVLCLPMPDGRYKVWLGPDLTVNLDEGMDANERLVEVTRRINHVLSAVIRERPESWNWMLKRFKGRPTEERGRYPAYSSYDPDSKSRRGGR